jgi:hypothetical protein
MGHYGACWCNSVEQGGPGVEDLCIHSTANLVLASTYTLSALDILALQVALEWCMLLQRSLLQMPWPADVMTLAAFSHERDSCGRTLFRGPRMKMGMCSGRPEAIQPDHLGRADYHGTTVNQAARWVL